MISSLLKVLWSSAARVPTPAGCGQNEVWLQIVENTATGAALSSDYAQCRVNERKFRRFSPTHAIMLRSEANRCGLGDGWT